MTQEQVLEILQKGYSIFLTGSAGSGKTYLLNKFIKSLKKTSKKVAITATTGLAATHLNGRTIHAWAGIGIKEELTSQLSRKIANDKKIADNIKSTDVLIIDEVSMLHDYRLDMIDQVCKLIKGSTKPFGGIQIILSGDLFQLPPIGSKKTDQNNLLQSDNHFIFNSEAWHNLKPVICYLSQQFRQRQDDDLQIILNAMRNNTLEQSHIDKLSARILPNPQNITELHCRNMNVDSVNEQKLALINSRPHNFAANTHSFTKDKKILEQLIKNSPAKENLVLKQGALVIFIKNDSANKYINGTLGKVIGFNKSNGYPVVETRNKRIIHVKKMTWSIINQEETELASLEQFPLKLAWAMTIHKSQGMTLDGAYIDLRQTFELGMGYVALSRLQSIDHLYLAGFNYTALKINPDVLKMDQLLKEESQNFINSVGYI